DDLVTGVQTCALPISTSGPLDADNDLRYETLAADIADFDAALKAGDLDLRGIEPDKARLIHAAARFFIEEIGDAPNATPPPESFGEFADYDRGAIAYHRGKIEEACAAWKQLL